MILENRLRRNVLVSTDHGIMIVNRFDCNHERVGHGQWLLDHGSVSTVEAEICRQALAHKGDPVIIDVGANIGTWCTWMARIFPQGQIYAFEPQQSIFQMLCGNCAINNLHNVRIYPMALGSKNQLVTVAVPDYDSFNDFGTFSLIDTVLPTQNGHTMTVIVCTLDDFVADFGIGTVDLIKIDAEGMDVEVLQGGATLLQNQRPVIFIEHCDNKVSRLDFIKQYMSQFRYQFTVHQNNVLCLPTHD